MICFGKSDIGRHRTTNQDEYRIGTLGDDIVYGLVCDGMGGENGGNVASKMACETIVSCLKKNVRSGLSDQAYKEIMTGAIGMGNVKIYDESMRVDALNGMGTTADLILVVKDKAYITHVGDSRVYRIRDGNIKQLTKDHSLVQTLVDKGEITPEQMKTHPQRNMITRALGISRYVEISCMEVSHIGDTIFLICSDGLTNACTDEEIKQVILNSRIDQICDRLIEAANQAGGNDNITAVIMI